LTIALVAVYFDSCFLCGSGAVNLSWKATDASGASWTYCKCAECGLVFLNPRPESRELEKYYDRAYYGPEHQRFERSVEGVILAFRKARARRVMRYLPEGGSLLDVGCGRGVFIGVLEKKGYKCFGAERYRLAARDAARRAKVMVGDSENMGLRSGAFDMVTFWQVLEHIENPDAAVAEAARLLKNNGRMLVQVPNPESLQARLSGPCWFHLDPPRHTQLFPLKCLDRLCGAHGFEREKLNTLNFEYSPFGALQSFWNLTGLRRDLLYDSMMSGDETRLSPSRATRVTLKALSGVLAPLAGLFALFEFLAGGGGTIEAVYRKKA